MSHGTDAYLVSRSRREFEKVDAHSGRRTVKGLPRLKHSVTNPDWHPAAKAVAKMGTRMAHKIVVVREGRGETEKRLTMRFSCCRLAVPALSMSGKRCL